MITTYRNEAETVMTAGFFNIYIYIFFFQFFQFFQKNSQIVVYVITTCFQRHYNGC